MRVLPMSVVLSSMILGGWQTGVRAQSLDADSPPVLNSAAGDQVDDSQNPEPGYVPQPSIDFPGLSAGVTLGQVYTDNLKLDADGTPQQTGLITQVQPFVRAAANGARFSGMVDYRLNGYLYERPSGHQRLSQNLDAGGRLTILPQHFFLDGSASYGQQIINDQLPAGSGSFFLGGNRANVAVASLSPYWVQDFGRGGTMSLRYVHGRVVYNHHGIPDDNGNALNGIPNVTSDAVQFNLASPRYRTWGWDFGYSEQHINPDFGRSVEFAMAKLGTSYRVNNNLRLLADGGKETRFRPDGTIEKLGSPFWDAGFNWGNGRNNFRFTFGHRFFGRTYQLSWTHEAALLTTNLSYVEQPTTYNRELLGTNFGSGGLPSIPTSPVIPSLRERRPYLSKRLSASATYSMPKGRLRLGVYDELRTFFANDTGFTDDASSVDDGRNERVLNADLAWSHSLGPFTTLTPSLRWERRKFADGQTNNNRYAEVSLTHRINTKNFGSVRVRHRTSGVDSPAPGAHGYTVNVLFVQWTHLF